LYWSGGLCTPQKRRRDQGLKHQIRTIRPSTIPCGVDFGTPRSCSPARVRRLGLSETWHIESKNPSWRTFPIFESSSVVNEFISSPTSQEYILRTGHCRRILSSQGPGSTRVPKVYSHLTLRSVNMDVNKGVPAHRDGPPAPIASNAPRARAKRVLRACDYCREKRVSSHIRYVPCRGLTKFRCQLKCTVEDRPCLNCRLYSVECTNTKLAKPPVVNGVDHPPSKRRKTPRQMPVGDLMGTQSEGEGGSTVVNVAAVSTLRGLPPAMPILQSRSQSPPHFQIASSASLPPSQPPRAPMLSRFPVHELASTGIDTGPYGQLILQLTPWEMSLSMTAPVKFLTRLKTI
jgi:hypothetical protein